MAQATAIIIGGGVIGLSTAYHLARKRFGRIILLEKGRPGDGSSSRAAGGITGLLWTETGVAVRKLSLTRFRELSQELDGYTYRQVGCLNLFDPVSWQEQQPLLSLYDRLGVPYEVIDADAMRSRWPDLHPDDSLTGLFDPLGGYSEPHEYLPALAAKTAALGVEIREGAQVSGFLRHNGRISGVVTSAGQVEADVVICTVHTWTQKLIEQLQWQLPIKAFVHQRCVSEPLTAPLDIPMVNAHPLGGYCRPADGNRLLIGFSTSEREEYPVPSLAFEMSGLSIPPGVRDGAWARLSRLLPGAGQPRWATEKVGLLSFSMDGEPILGPVEQSPGLYIAASFHSGGFAYSPAAGLLLAEWVADGKTSIDLTAFSPDRFSPARVDAYLSTTHRQQDAVPRRH